MNQILFKWIAGLGCLGLIGCASGIQVVSREHTQTVTKADRNFFLSGPASDTRLISQPLAADQKGQEFYVSWSQPQVDTVHFEYRQASVPNQVQKQTATPGTRHSHVFLVRGESGHDVTAWRVTLLRDGTTIAERQSALW
jgi:hypothetical protein